MEGEAKAQAEAAEKAAGVEAGEEATTAAAAEAEVEAEPDAEVSEGRAKTFQRCKEDFECENCGYMQNGTGYTNHCEQCLFSKHVDINPGDRAADCGGLMAPVAVDTVKNSYRIYQRCKSCDHERWNKMQEHDCFDTLIEVMSACNADHTHQSGRSGKSGGRGGGSGGGRGGGKGRGKGRGKRKKGKR